MNDVVMESRPKMTPLEQVRLMSAADAYKVHKSIYLDPVTDEIQEGFQPWAQFRDEFLADWKSNRRVVTEKEADVIFERIADESLSELDTIGATDVNQVVDQVAEIEADVELDAEIVAEARPQAIERANGNGDGVVAPAPKRGRPAKSKSATVTKLVKGKVSKPAKSTPVRKAAARKADGSSTSSKAERIIETYQEKGWSRKDILAKLQSQINGLGAAYASTLYQKFAK